MNEISKDLDDGFELSPEVLRGCIDSAVNKLGSMGYSQKEKEMCHKLLIDVYEKEMLLKDAMHISDGIMAEFYVFAYSEFTSGNYQKARGLFTILTRLDPHNFQYALGLAVTLHRMKEYDLAVGMYMNCTFLEITNPIPYIYAYDCFLNKNSKLAAKDMLDNCIKYTGNKPEYAALKCRAIALRTALLKQLKEEGKIV